MKILGISAFYHDSAAALVVDGRIVAAAQEERFTRRKHDAAFPRQAMDYCLAAGGLRASDLDHVVFYDKPFLKFERLLETYLSFAPRGLRSFSAALPAWVQEKLFQKSVILQKLRAAAPEVDWATKLLFSEHHLSHAASAFFPSPYEEAAILTLDGVGEWTTTSLAVGKGNQIQILREIHFPHSLGLLYSAFTYYTGFKVNSGEYKVMGLAPYGTPRFASLIKKNLIDVKEDGTFRLDLDYFDYCTGMTMTNAKFDALFGAPARKSEDPISQRDMDLAASVQSVLEEVILKLCRSIARETGLKNLCLAGGVALNCVANGKVLRDGAFQNVWIQPAAGDAGGALGAALAVTYLSGRTPRTSGKDQMNGAYLGPEFTQPEIERRLRATGAIFQVLEDDELLDACAQALIEQKALGWFQGRMEFGPRALGARSILGDPRSPSMQTTLNLKVKFRESFRPFAPVILREDLKHWFELDTDSPYMLFVADLKPEHRINANASGELLFGIERLKVPRSVIPATTHVDYSARIQTAHAETHPRYYGLIRRFKEKTGCPVVVNTSFNVRGEPIVCTPEDAFHCFMGTGIEALAIGNCYLRKEAQNPALVQDYLTRFELD
jgi:carbamoyltransferase